MSDAYKKLNGASEGSSPKWSRDIVKTSQASLSAFLLLMSGPLLAACLPLQKQDAKWTFGSEKISVPVYRYGPAVVALSGMNVNTDGAPRSYSVKDHGINYVANGLSVLDQDRCVQAKDWDSGVGQNGRKSTREMFLDAESRDFGPGTAQFCVYALQIDNAVLGPMGKPLLGNGGPGKLRRITVPRETIEYYSSTTSMQIGGKFVDATLVPYFTVPKDAPRAATYFVPKGSLGLMVNLKNNRRAVAVAADRGPNGKFAEGSVALLQLLKMGRTQNPPPWNASTAPKPCSAVAEDGCIPFPYSYRGDGDIRARQVLDSGVLSIMFRSEIMPEEITGNNGRRQAMTPALAVDYLNERRGALFTSLGGEDYVVQCITSQLLRK